METQTRSVFTQSLIYGGLTGLASILFSLVMYIFDVQQKNPVMYLAFAILLGGIILANLNYRNKFRGGVLSFGQAFLIGLLTIVIAGILSSLYTYLFYSFFDPAAHAKIVDTAMEQAELKMIEQGTPSEQMDMGLKMARMFMSPLAMALFGLLWSLILGAVLALITAIFVKKEDKSFEAAVKDIN